MTVYTLTLKTLTPLHIGDGEELRQDFDFVSFNGRTYRLDEDAILAAKESKWARLQAGSFPLPGKLLDEPDFQNSALFRYWMSGVPRSKKVDARVKSFIKDVYDCPYIPGSSLKGALRTALAWTGWKEVKPLLDRNAIGRSRSWAAQPLEKKLFGPNPNHDLLRALHVADLTGPAKPGEGLLLLNAQVLTKKEAGSPVELEALRGDTELRGSLTIDDALFSPLAERELHFNDRQHWLKELPARIQAHSLARIRRLTEWFETAENCAPIASFYRTLAGLQLEPGSALLQVGWGAGWDGKTFWTHLTDEKELFEQLIRDFRMHKAAPGSPPRKTGDAFPRSKRAAMLVKDGAAVAAAPFGWVLITLEQKGEGPAWIDLSTRSVPEATPKTKPSPPNAAAKPATATPKPAAEPTTTHAPPKTPTHVPLKPPSTAAPLPRPILTSFNAAPKVGDRFYGEYFDTKGESLLLSIPGLDADTQAYAVVEVADLPRAKRRYQEDEPVLLEVGALELEGKVWRVLCKGV